MISFYFRLYLILYVCAVRFDVTRNFENFLDFGVKPQSESAVQTGGEEEEEEETTGREEVRRSHAVARREQSRVTKNMHGRANPTLD